MERLAEAVRAAERPVFVAGRGGRPFGAELREVAARSGALLAESAVAKDLFRSAEQWSLGVSGGFASPLAAELIGERRPDRRLGVRPQHVDDAARAA